MMARIRSALMAGVEEACPWRFLASVRSWEPGWDRLPCRGSRIRQSWVGGGYSGSSLVSFDKLRVASADRDPPPSLFNHVSALVS